MSNYFDNQKNWSWIVDDEGAKVFTDHGTHTHTVDVTNIPIGEMANNTGKTMGDSHRITSHDYKTTDPKTVANDSENTPSKNVSEMRASMTKASQGSSGYLLSTDSLYRSVRSVDGDKLTPSELLFSMSYILVSSIGSAAKELLTVIPSYEQEKLTNTLDFSGHGDSPYSSFRGGCCRNGLGFRLSQSRTVESKPILTQDELTRMQALHLSLLYNAETAGRWTANITR